MGQNPKLDSLRTDAQLAAITANAPSGTRDDRNKSIDASAKYKVAKAQYDEQQKAPVPAPPKSVDNKKTIPSYKKGGKVRKTGLALVHKGERVIPKNKVSSVVVKKNSSPRKKTQRKQG